MKSSHSPARRESRAGSAGRGQAKKAGKASTPSAKRGSRAAPLASLATEVLAAELKRRRNEIPRLEAEAAALRAQLADVEARIAFLERIGDGPSAAAPSRDGAAARSGSRARSEFRRPAAAPRAAAGRKDRGTSRATRKGKPTLGERIAAFLAERGSLASPREIAEAMGVALGREVNQSLLVHVSLTLRKLVNQGRVVQPGRGQYGLAPGAASGSGDARMGSGESRTE